MYSSETEYVIYTKSGCDFCRKLKNLLINEKIRFTEINCDNQLSQTLSSMQGIIGKKWKTFPMVFVNSIFIGGYTETVKYIDRHRTFTFFY
jgi:glutaredoxin